MTGDGSHRGTAAYRHIFVGWRMFTETTSVKASRSLLRHHVVDPCPAVVVGGESVTPASTGHCRAEGPCDQHDMAHHHPSIHHLSTTCLSTLRHSATLWHTNVLTSQVANLPLSQGLTSRLAQHTRLFRHSLCRALPRMHCCSCLASVSCTSCLSSRLTLYVSLRRLPSSLLCPAARMWTVSRTTARRV